MPPDGFAAGGQRVEAQGDYFAWLYGSFTHNNLASAAVAAVEMMGAAVFYHRPGPPTR